jgi:hypothetical protein
MTKVNILETLYIEEGGNIAFSLECYYLGGYWYNNRHYPVFAVLKERANK